MLTHEIENRFSDRVEESDDRIVRVRLDPGENHRDKNDPEIEVENLPGHRERPADQVVPENHSQSFAMRPSSAAAQFARALRSGVQSTRHNIRKAGLDE